MAHLSRKTHTWVRWTFGLSLVGLFSAHALDADQVRALLLLRVFSFDQSLKKRVSDAVNLAVLYRAADATSVAAADDWMRSFRSVASGVTVQALPFKVEKLAFETGPKLRSTVQARHISILLVCDSLDDDL